MVVGWNGMASLPDQIKNNKNINTDQLKMWPMTGFVAQFSDYWKTKSQVVFLSDKAYEILESHFPTLESIENE